MIDAELQTIVAKLHKLKALRRARARVRQLERELSGEPATAEELPYVPEFLRQRAPVLIARDTDPRSTEQRAPAAVAHSPIGRAA
jgi:hypothetical protein